MNFRIRALALALALPVLPVAPLPALAQTMTHAETKPITIGDLELTGPFTRAMLPGAKAGGGFVTITNKGGADDTLISAASEAAGMVQLHEMTMDNGVMKMREKDGGIAIPAGQTVTLQPGGLHIMFMQVEKPFEEGQSVRVTLTFEKAGTIDIDLPVQAFGAEAPMMKMTH